MATGPMSENVLLYRGDDDPLEIGCTTSPHGAGRRFYTAEELFKGDVIVHNGNWWVIDLVKDWSGTYESEASHQQSRPRIGSVTPDQRTTTESRAATPRPSRTRHKCHRPDESREARWASVPTAIYANGLMRVGLELTRCQRTRVGSIALCSDGYLDRVRRRSPTIPPTGEQR